MRLYDFMEYKRFAKEWSSTATEETSSAAVTETTAHQKSSFPANSKQSRNYDREYNLTQDNSSSVTGHSFRIIALASISKIRFIQGFSDCYSSSSFLKLRIVNSELIHVHLQESGPLTLRNY
jgi:hypothetical protein